MKKLLAISMAVTLFSCASSPRVDLHCHHLQHKSPFDIKATLEKEGFTVAADWSGNSIIAITSDDDWSQILGRIREIDVP